MSNEMKDWLAERDAYEKEVYDDYTDQFGEYNSYSFIDYLLSRMYHGTLPSREPRDEI